MSHPLLGVLLAAMAGLPGARAPEPLPTAVPAADSTAYDLWYAGLRAAEIDASMGAEVHDLVLERDEGTLRFSEGRLQLLAPIQGRVYGLVFVGRGTFTLTPPIDVERAQMKRVYGDERLEREFRTAVIFFTDWTLDELGQAVTWQPLPPPADARREVEEALKYVTDDEGWASRDLMVPLLNRGGGIFYAHMARDRGDPFIFTVDPYDFEEIALYRRAEGKGQHRENVVRFHKRSDYATGRSIPQEALDLVVADRYDIDTTVRENLEVVGRATLHLALQAEGHRWVPFSLYGELEVDSVRWSDGSTVPFARGKEAPDVWVDVSGAPSVPDGDHLPLPRAPARAAAEALVDRDEVDHRLVSRAPVRAGRGVSAHLPRPRQVHDGHGGHARLGGADGRRRDPRLRDAARSTRSPSTSASSRRR